MSLLTVDEYIKARETYNYDSDECFFIIKQTGKLNFAGAFEGIYGRKSPKHRPMGINLRMFEKICQEVFNDYFIAQTENSLSRWQYENLHAISCAIVYWKMSSQGGRATICSDRVRTNWNAVVKRQLMEAYERKSLAGFKIPGVRIPTATAFLRFLYPDEFGIMDSRIVGKHTQKNGITSLNLRKDGYIIDTKSNEKKYYNEYVAFLRNEANWLNKTGAEFIDYNEDGQEIKSCFRPCDVEMALFNSTESNKGFPI